jgi:hypothetical protein
MFGNMSEKLCVVVFGLWLITKMRLSTHKRRLVWSLLVHVTKAFVNRAWEDQLRTRVQGPQVSPHPLTDLHI